MHLTYAFFALVLFFFVFGLHIVTIHNINFVAPTFYGDTFPVQVFKIIQRDFMPTGVKLIVTNPLSGFMAQLEIVLIMTFLCVAPFLFYKLVRYVSPALFWHEKRQIVKSLFFSTLLFVLGCLFAYYYMIPLTFKFMYPFTTDLGITPFFLLDSFMSWVVCIAIATGITFLLPVFMILLSSLGIVKPKFWRTRWRHALVILLIFCAVITPDQTGFTMVILFIPLSILYVIGIFLTARLESRDVEDLSI